MGTRDDYSVGEQSYITQGVEHGVRCDGRGCEDFRTVRIELGPIVQASGSARLKLGGTDVIVAVKADTGEPSSDAPDCGCLHVSVDCSPCAGPKFQGRGGDDISTELTKGLARNLGVGPSGRGGGLDLKGLCILAGKICWVLYLDVVVFNIDGNVADAVCMAAKAALGNTLIPAVEVTPSEVDGEPPELELDEDPLNATRLNVSSVPLTVTVSQIGRAYAVDLGLEEEACVKGALEVSVNPKGAVCGVMKKGTNDIHPIVVQEMMMMAQRVAPKLLKGIDTFAARRDLQ